MSQMHHPPHPGAILREDVLPELGMSMSRAARELGVSRVTLSRVIHEHAAISPRMALKLEAWFDRLGYQGGRAETWLQMQMAHDLWKMRHGEAA
ncbi:MAG: addiction module antidote protein, HigA family [Gammaproteobacteria bacterium]|nr:MAG: addiction module antidote protein, HigA family [Gammaproteobacteria bacterium]RTZ76869.1 MAG: addiction module antidote protein, HigA family [Gammaproteobacteria bacterium]